MRTSHLPFTNVSLPNMAGVLVCVMKGCSNPHLAAPVNRWAYGEDDLCALAAAYAFGVARNHPFIDGNKRTAWVLARLFLRLNGAMMTFAPEEAIRTFLALAAGNLSEEELADWFRGRLIPDIS